MPADRLTSSECADLGNLATTLDWDRVRLYRSNSRGIARLVRAVVLRLSRNRAIALGNHVILPVHCQHDLPLLAHELTHCAQYQSWGFVRYFGKGLMTQIKDLLYRQFGIGSSQYHYRIEAGKPFQVYGMEQQAQIVEDCYRGDPEAGAICPFRPARSFNQAVPSA